MYDHRWLSRSLAALLLFASMCNLAAAEEEAATTGGVGTAVTEDELGPDRGRLSFSLSNDFTTAYFFRGIVQERKGFIWQPSAEIGINLYQGEGVLSSVDLGLGIWGSVHEKETLSDGNGAAPLYEMDYYPSLRLAWSFGLETAATYYFYTSPNGAFDTIEEIELEFTYDDSELLGAFALNPYAKFAFETRRTSFGTPKKGGYAELGIEPSINVTCPYDEAGKYPLTLSLPMALGLSMYHFYDDGADDDALGFGSAGVHASIPLAFIPPDYGDWSVSSCVNVLFLSDVLESVNQNDGVFAIWTTNVLLEY